VGLKSFEETAMRNSILPSGVAGIALLLAAGCAHDGSRSEKLRPSEVPPQVRAAMEVRFPGAQVSRVEREKEHGETVYDYELRHEGRKYEMDVREDGTVLEVEKQIADADVPERVRAAVREKYPKAAIREVMEVDKVSGRRETPDHYEVLLSGAGGKAKEVNVSMDGRVTEEGNED
jgi:hypothetical protein